MWCQAFFGGLRHIGVLPYFACAKYYTPNLSFFLLSVHVQYTAICKILPDKTYIQLNYFAHFKKLCNLKNPVTYNEKLQWLKIHDRKPEYSDMVDKYEVRKIIEKTVGGEYLIPCYGVYQAFDEIDLDKLPEQFVLKCTHDSGSVIICKDKAKFDIADAKQSLDAAMKRNYYRRSTD